jgi:hypothetical protein
MLGEKAKKTFDLCRSSVREENFQFFFDFLDGFEIFTSHFYAAFYGFLR